MKLTLYALIAICFSLNSYGIPNSSPKISYNDSFISIVTESNEFQKKTSDFTKAAENVVEGKEEAPFVDTRLKIRLGFYATSNFKRQILITIDKRATDGVDYGFDAVVKDIFPNDLYWVLDNNKLNIQGVNSW